MRVVVGRIGRAHGVHGEVAVDIRTDDPERRFAVGSRLWAGERALTIAATRPHAGRLLVRFDGVADRTAAEALRGTLVEIDRADGERPEDPDEFFIDDLVGLAVQTPTGDPLGTVVDVWHLPGQEVLAVRRDDAPEWHLPFVTALVPQVDLDAGILIATPPDGLVDGVVD